MVKKLTTKIYAVVYSPDFELISWTAVIRGQHYEISTVTPKDRLSKQINNKMNGRWITLMLFPVLLYDKSKCMLLWRLIVIGYKVVIR